ncbi:WXG100 family type VII secretion target [Mycolicibacterium brumae]|uniref:WXG100 family type VII secretion target n=1 Tax=Mycolicibacterium brumae TaxID=85968 RepID=A0A2G5PHP3_9MYCO|nr:WXG100 family type VII secretion target [Mycolicibacterium brumae]MCV7194521.1 WXG100 family type VII secretion target [Mycolicibacterium brumae]PIB77680.1 WXG100 family type VII secretion target [Mycolicibacterium brumae]RWA20126.1 hypothetical protein MBRU_15960 [Mycolicibacterium brumae DSM 44177]UWW10056.1 ESX secretion-associated protein esxU [Mycolicibacterium brumae]
MKGTTSTPTPPGDAGLRSDLTLMKTVADLADARSADLALLLGQFGAAMQAVPDSVWGGPAAAEFKNVMTRWNLEARALTTALTAIATTLRANTSGLRAAGGAHSDLIARAAVELPVR